MTLIEILVNLSGNTHLIYYSLLLMMPETYLSEYLNCMLYFANSLYAILNSSFIH